MKKKGAFIAVYGINNIGKSTHCRLLVKKLKKSGYDSVYVKYPIYKIKPSGPFINNILRNPRGQKITEDQLQMWFVINRYQYQQNLKKFLSQGKIVVAEDYVYTGIAWGMAKGLEEKWLKDMNKYLLKEDLAILFSGQRDISAKERHHVHEQNDKLIAGCTEIFEQLAKKHKFKKITVQKKIPDTAEKLGEVVDDFLANR